MFETADEAEIDDVTLAEVQVVPPGHLTGQDQWTMEPVVEIWEGIAPDRMRTRRACSIVNWYSRQLNT